MHNSTMTELIALGSYRSIAGLLARLMQWPVPTGRVGPTSTTNRLFGCSQVAAATATTCM